MNKQIGSSPLARGTLLIELLSNHCQRFIPTRAGNTAAITGRTCEYSVHPHSRGEHVPITTVANCKAGSSPLARGTLQHQPSARVQDWFIPTRAGNTLMEATNRIAGTVHPHSRGEHDRSRRRGRRRLRFIPTRAGNTAATAGLTCAYSGSSPLARGTHDARDAAFAIGRFIPTRAGNTTDRGGEVGDGFGSSPLARGTRRPRPA